VQDPSHTVSVIFLVLLALRSGILFSLPFTWLQSENRYMLHVI
jgi:hypothetical protein